jgi:predicted MFS family arabinose efflux permease
MGVQTPGELAFLVLLMVIGLVAGAAARWLVRRIGPLRPREPEAERTTSPRLFYTGLALCSAVGTLSVLDGRPLFATMFFAFATVYAVGLVLLIRDRQKALGREN